MKFVRLLCILALNTLTLISCQGSRMPQSPLLGSLKRKSAHIAFVGLDGNIV